jgi:hypothetical protein
MFKLLELCIYDVNGESERFNLLFRLSIMFIINLSIKLFIASNNYLNLTV